MSRLFLSTESDTIMAGVRRVCANAGWDVECGPLDITVFSRVAEREVDALLVALPEDGEKAIQIVSTLTVSLDFFPLLFLCSGEVPGVGERSGFVYRISPERLDELEHVLISLSCAGFHRSDAAVTPPRASGSVPRVLVVDDDPDLCHQLGHWLRVLEEFDVQIAHSGFEAGAFLQNFCPDVAVVDIMLGDMDGRDVCTFIRAQERLGHTRILAVSGVVLPEEMEERQELFDLFLAKPFGMGELMRCLRGLLHRA